MSDHDAACPHCGEPISVDAIFCPHCGSSDEDGWRGDDEMTTDDDDFDYDEFIRDEFSGHVTNTNTRPLWRLVAVALLGFAALGYWLALM